MIIKNSNVILAQTSHSLTLQNIVNKQKFKLKNKIKHTTIRGTQTNHI